MLTAPRLSLALQALPGYRRDMSDLKLHVPATEKVKVDAETLAAINRGLKDADEGRAVPIEEVREMIPKWCEKMQDWPMPPTF
jgi:predicted transcriptional regulator